MVATGLRAAWNAWRRLARRIGDIQARILLTLFYYVVLGPFALVLGKATGVPLVLNTSVNLKGEPIVNTPAEAFRTFTQSGMEVLVLGDCVVEKAGATGGA
jgi:tRNA A37 threonylcarbamoyladenosine synthetase subunit TsaC/SUA5/YrdC